MRWSYVKILYAQLANPIICRLSISMMLAHTEWLPTFARWKIQSLFIKIINYGHWPRVRGFSTLNFCSRTVRIPQNHTNSSGSGSWTDRNAGIYRLEITGNYVFFILNNQIIIHKSYKWTAWVWWVTLSLNIRVWVWRCVKSWLVTVTLVTFLRFR